MGTTNVQQSYPNLHEDCKDLRNALRGISSNEKKVIEILGQRNQSQRDSLSEAYKLVFGEDLRKRLKSSISGKLEKCLTLWMMDPFDRDAVLLNEALREGGPKKDRVIIGMLCTRTSKQIYLIKQAYYTMFNQTLESHIDGSGFAILEPQTKSKWAFWKGSEAKSKEPPKRVLAITKLLLALARGSRPENTAVDRHIALSDAHHLNKVCTGKIGNEEMLIRIFTTRSSYQLSATMNYYQQHYGHDFEKVLSKQGSGEFLQALRAALQSLRQPSKFYAEELSDALSGIGTDEETLVLIITTRAEVDMQFIKLEFMNECKRSLEDVVRDETIGKLRQLLLTILGQGDMLFSPRPSNCSMAPSATSYYTSPYGSRQPSDGSASYFSGSVGSSAPNSFQS